MGEATLKDNFTIPEEHQKLVNDRKSKADINPEILLDWETASKDLRP